MCLGGAHLPVVGEPAVDVLQPLATQRGEPRPQLLRDDVTAGAQPAAHLHQRVVVARQSLQDLWGDRGTGDGGYVARGVQDDSARPLFPSFQVFSFSPVLPVVTPVK